MSNEEPQKESNAPDFVIQDGVRCPLNPPWTRKTGIISVLIFSLINILAFLVLLQTSTVKLIIWLAVLFLMIYPFRYFVCARCPYYGKPCAFYGLDRLIPRMFKKQEGRSMKNGFYLDMISIGFLLLFPLPDMWRYGGALLLIVWLALLTVFYLHLTLNACSVCPLTFCPAYQSAARFRKMIGRE